MQKILKTRRFTQTKRYVFNGPNIIRYIFANKTIATCHSLRQYTVDINQRARQAIHFYIRKKFMSLTWYQFISSLNPRLNFTFIENVIQTDHSARVLDFLKTVEQLISNSLRRTINSNQFRMIRFNFLQLIHQTVINRIAHTRLV